MTQSITLASCLAEAPGGMSYVRESLKLRLRALLNQDQTRASRVAIEAFLKRTNSQLWIQHDFVGNAKLKKSPDFYD